jgi:hypothetical protein
MVVFDAAAGRVICRECRETGLRARPYRVSPAALAELRRRQNKPILEPTSRLENGALEKIAAAVEDFARYHLGGSKIKSLDSLPHGRSVKAKCTCSIRRGGPTLLVGGPVASPKTDPLMEKIVSLCKAKASLQSLKSTAD